MVVNRWIAIGASSAAVAVGLGAFGAHILRDRLPAAAAAAFATGVDYQFLHSLGLILIGMRIPMNPSSRMLAAAPWVMLAGMVLFSGSLYLLGITGVRSIGTITPLGGLALIAAWLLMAVGAARGHKRSRP